MPDLFDSQPKQLLAREVAKRPHPDRIRWDVTDLDALATIRQLRATPSDDPQALSRVLAVAIWRLPRVEAERVADVVIQCMERFIGKAA